MSSVMSDSAIPWTVLRQAPLSMGFPRQEYWSGLPFPPPEDLPDPGIKPASSALQGDSLPLSYLKRVNSTILYIWKLLTEQILVVLITRKEIFKIALLTVYNLVLDVLQMLSKYSLNGNQLLHIKKLTVFPSKGDLANLSISEASIKVLL